ncbi:hypothetical protein PVAND_015640 [Polypedilum vanderplanki]|nr:hypothetical protein PVAND_015640 [Polypedilum vanderplanki]
MTNLKPREVYFRNTLNLCTLTKKPPGGIVLKAVIENLQKVANFKFECPFQKGLNFKINEITTKNIFFSMILPPNIERSFSMVLKEGNKATLFVSLVIYYMRVEIDD